MGRVSVGFLDVLGTVLIIAGVILFFMLMNTYNTPYSDNLINILEQAHPDEIYKVGDTFFVLHKEYTTSVTHNGIQTNHETIAVLPLPKDPHECQSVHFIIEDQFGEKYTVNFQITKYGLIGNNIIEVFGGVKSIILPESNERIFHISQDEYQEYKMKLVSFEDAYNDLKRKKNTAFQKPLLLLVTGVIILLSQEYFEVKNKKKEKEWM